MNRKPTENQQYILDFCKASGGQFTKKELLNSGADHWYYCNSSFHVGEVLGRMVKNGMLERVKRGTYKFGKRKHSPNQITLF